MTATRTVKTPNLPLTNEEKRRLRKQKLRLKDIHTISVKTLSDILSCPEERAEYLRASAIFQQIPSIGVKFAETLVEKLDVCSLDALKEKDGAELLDKLEQRMGYWTDPCVEDQIRCVIHHANHQGSTKQWFDFTDERKKYRKKAGYPASRPKKAWYD